MVYHHMDLFLLMYKIIYGDTISTLKQKSLLKEVSPIMFALKAFAYSFP